MGEEAEALINGDNCQHCGEAFHDEAPGHPRSCCQEEPEGIAEILEMVFIKEMRTHGYILEDGEVYIQLIVGECMNRQEFLDSGMCVGKTEEFKRSRLDLYDKLKAYYKFHYEISQLLGT